MGPVTLGGLWEAGRSGGTGWVHWRPWCSPALLPVTGLLGLIGLDAADVVGGASLQRAHQVIGLFLRWRRRRGWVYRWDPWTLSPPTPNTGPGDRGTSGWLPGSHGARRPWSGHSSISAHHRDSILWVCLILGRRPGALLSAAPTT